jgi:hypothetical protein
MFFFVRDCKVFEVLVATVRFIDIYSYYTLGLSPKEASSAGKEDFIYAHESFIYLESTNSSGL